MIDVTTLDRTGASGHEVSLRPGALAVKKKTPVPFYPVLVSQANANRPPNGDARLLPPARKTLDILTHHRDLACVREPEALARLPQGERKNWQAFWAGAADLLKRAE